MEEAPARNPRFWNVFPPAVTALAFSLVWGHAASNFGGILHNEARATEAERVVELLQETHGPESVIADQQAEAVRGHEAAAWGWYYLGGSFLIEALAFGGAAMAVARHRRQQGGYKT